MRLQKCHIEHMIDQMLSWTWDYLNVILNMEQIRYISVSIYLSTGHMLTSIKERYI
jgi:hypothetical protein